MDEVMNKKKLMVDKERELEDTFKTWDKGEYTYDGAMDDLIKLKPLSGEKLGDIMKDCTICPVGNGTCFSFMTIQVYGFHPEKPGKLTELMVCALGIEGDGEKCPLNK